MANSGPPTTPTPPLKIKIILARTPNTQYPLHDYVICELRQQNLTMIIRFWHLQGVRGV